MTNGQKRLLLFILNKQTGGKMNRSLVFKRAALALGAVVLACLPLGDRKTNLHCGRQTRMRNLFLGIAFLCAVLLGTGRLAPVQAQVLKAQILGAVTDTSGAVVPSAAVTLTEIRTNAVRTALTTESGLYVVPNLDPGIYEEKVELEGFNVAVRGDHN
jgi:hypothetical protein